MSNILIINSLPFSCPLPILMRILHKSLIIIIIHRVYTDIPIDLHAHQIRHVKVLHWLENGMNIVQISFLLGHANL